MIEGPIKGTGPATGTDGAEPRVHAPMMFAVRAMLQEVASELAEHAFTQMGILSDHSCAGAPPTAGTGEEPVRFDFLPPTILGQARFKGLGVHVRAGDGTTVGVVNPVLPVAALWISTISHRVGDVLAADSGETDGSIPDVRMQAAEDGVHRMVTAWADNPHPLAVAGRRRGALQPSGLTLGSDLGLCLGVLRPGSAQRGAAPCPDTALALALHRTRLWQGRFNPLPGHRPTGASVPPPSVDVEGSLPEPLLFRHLRDGDHARRYEAVTRRGLNSFVHDLLGEVQARLDVRRGHGRAGIAGRRLHPRHGAPLQRLRAGTIIDLIERGHGSSPAGHVATPWTVHYLTGRNGSSRGVGR